MAIPGTAGVLGEVFQITGQNRTSNFLYYVGRSSRNGGESFFSSCTLERSLCFC